MVGLMRLALVQCPRIFLGNQRKLRLQHAILHTFYGDRNAH